MTWHILATTCFVHFSPTDFTSPTSPDNLLFDNCHINLMSFYILSPLIGNNLSSILFLDGYPQPRAKAVSLSGKMNYLCFKQTIEIS